MRLADWKIDRVLKNLLGNFSMLASYFTFPRSYRVYIFFRRLANKTSIFSPAFIPDPDFENAIFVVEGFRHSGNTFLATCAKNHSKKIIISHNHRLWALSEAVRYGVPFVVLIRPCQEVIRSVAARRGAGNYLAFDLWPSTIALSWFFYYVYAIYFFEAKFVFLEDIIRSPKEVFVKLGRLVGGDVLFDEADSIRNQASYEGIAELDFSLVVRFLLEINEKLYGVARKNSL